MLKKTFKNHSEINEKSMEKCVDFLIDFLIDFLTVFGKVLGRVLAVKIDEKHIANLMKIFINFLWFFELKRLLNGRPGGSQNRDISSTFRDPVPGTPPGRQMDPKWSQNEVKMEPKRSQNGAKMSSKLAQNDAKMSSN